MTHYISLLKTKHRVTTPYHPRTNGKVENFNGFLGMTLTRLLTNQPTILWDQYLPQALFAARIRIHVTTKKSPYYLLFGCQPRLPTDDNDPRQLDISEDWETTLQRIEVLHHARMQANRRLIDRAIAAGKVRKELVKESSLSIDQWVLVRAEERNKFEGRWFGPYRVVKTMPLGTYRLADPKGNELRTLINGQRLIPARLRGDRVETLWNSSKIQGRLRKHVVQIDAATPEVAELFEKEQNNTPSYDELATIPPDPGKRPGVRLDQVEEEDQDEQEIPTSQFQPLQSDTVEIDWDQENETASEGRELTLNSPPEVLAEDIEPNHHNPLVTDSFDPEPTVTIDSMEGVERATPIPTWQKELAASIAQHQRDTTRYGLRPQPTKKRLEDTE